MYVQSDNWLKRWCGKGKKIHAQTVFLKRLEAHLLTLGIKTQRMTNSLFFNFMQPTCFSITFTGTIIKEDSPEPGKRNHKTYPKFLCNKMVWDNPNGCVAKFEKSVDVQEVADFIIQTFHQRLLINFIFETPVYCGALKVWRILNLNTGSLYTHSFETKEEADAGIEDGQNRGGKIVKRLDLLADVTPRLQ